MTKFLENGEIVTRDDSWIDELKTPQMSMSTFLATEGGRKCPFCGRYAKSKELGWVGVQGNGFIVDAYGHLPGTGCNKPKEAA